MFYKIILISFSFLSVLKVYCKPTEQYYIIDSSSVKNLSEYDHHLLHKVFNLYHDSKYNHLHQLKLVSYLTDHLNDQIWEDYNLWLINECNSLLLNQNLSEHENYGIKRILAEAYNNRGYALTTKGLLDSALFYHRKSLQLDYRLKYLPGIAEAFNNIGFVYGEKGLTKLQIMHYLNSLRIKKFNNDQRGIAISLNNIGFVYKKNKDYKNALEYYNKSLKISKEINDEKSTAATLNNISLIYLYLENYKKAKFYINESRAIREKTNEPYGLSMCYETIGNIYEKQNLIDSAKYYYTKSLSLREKTNDQKGIAASLYMLGKLYYLTSDFDQSIPLLKNSLQKSLSTNTSSLILENSKLLGKIFKEKEDYKSSLEMYNLYSSFNDSIIQKSISEELEKQKNMATLEKKNSIHRVNSRYKDLLIQKSNRDFFIVLFILIVSTIVFIILLASIRKKMNIIKTHQNDINIKNELLVDLNTKQSNLLNTRDTLLKEIHHRVKNNLQVITSLLALQSSFIKDDKIKKVFRYTQYRINSMAMVHEMLYQTEDLSKINLNKYITNLSKNLISSMKGSKDDIKLDLQVPDLFLNVDTVIPLGLLINEILTNSLKYGMKDQSCMIYIKIIHLEKNNFVLYIGDNGNGFNSDTSFRAPGSLGLMLIHNLTLQLQGTIEKNNEQEGTNYIIAFKENLTSLKNYEEGTNSRR